MKMKNYKSFETINQSENLYESDQSSNKITLKLERRSFIRSPFIKHGEYLKEYKNESLYEIKNFQYLKLGDDLHVIGSGGFGDVYLSKNNKNGQYYAIKKVIIKINFRSTNQKFTRMVEIEKF